MEALAHLHAQGILHRDLTPKNILLTREGHPKVMDFGLAYLLQESRHLTRTGYTLGTPTYMAPEQAKGLPLTPQGRPVQLWGRALPHPHGPPAL